MPVYLDGESFDAGTMVLAEALDAVRLHLVPQQRVISEVLLNGNPIHGQALIDVRGAEISDIRVDVVSEDPVMLVVQTLVMVREGLPSTYEKQQEAIIKIHQGQIDAGLLMVKETIEYWDCVMGGLTLGVETLNIDPKGVTFLSRDLTSWVVELRQCLGDLQDAVEQKNTRKVQGALAGVWPDLTQSWGRLLDHVSGELGKGRG